jgi:hypothetical protein
LLAFSDIGQVLRLVDLSPFGKASVAIRRAVDDDPIVSGLRLPVPWPKELGATERPAHGDLNAAQPPYSTGYLFSGRYSIRARQTRTEGTTVRITPLEHRARAKA